MVLYTSDEILRIVVIVSVCKLCNRTVRVMDIVVVWNSVKDWFSDYI